MHDVFISYRSENRPWVAVLADNLERCGLKVWLHLAESAPVSRMAEADREALENSRHGVVLATPEALDAGGSEEALEAMLLRRRASPDFTIIPLFFGRAAIFPFFDARAGVDFATPTPDAYQAAFSKLLRWLRNLPPDVPAALPASFEIPDVPIYRLEATTALALAPSESAFLELFFDGVYGGNRPIMLLAQAGQDKTPMLQAILRQARAQFGKANTLHLTPSGQPDADKSDYFNYLSNQIDKASNSQRSGFFEALIAERLVRGKIVFLLISRMEEGSADGRRALSMVLRNLTERYPDWLKLVLCGAEQLLDLRVKEGKMSPLRNAQLLYWPEPTVADILHWQAPEVHPLTEKTAQTLLRLTGGNPRLIRQALKMQQVSAPLDFANVAQKLRQDPMLRSRFAAYRYQGDAERLANLLKRDDLGHYEPRPIQAVLRRLYWDGLLAVRDDRFCWRSELIRLIGRETLGV